MDLSENELGADDRSLLTSLAEKAYIAASSIKTWRLASIILAVLLAIFFILFLVFFFLWIFTKSPSGPCPVCPSCPTCPSCPSVGATGPPTAPNLAVTSYQTSTNVCALASPTNVTPLIFINQSDKPAQLWYAAAATICAGNNPCSTPQNMVAASPLLQPGGSFSLSVYLQSRLQTYIYSSQGQGSVINSYWNGVANGTEISTPNSNPVTLTVTGSQSTSYSAYAVSS